MYAVYALRWGVRQRVVRAERPGRAEGACVRGHALLCRSVLLDEPLVVRLHHVAALDLVARVTTEATEEDRGDPGFTEEHKLRVELLPHKCRPVLHALLIPRAKRRAAIAFVDGALASHEAALVV